MYVYIMVGQWWKIHVDIRWISPRLHFPHRPYIHTPLIWILLVNYFFFPHADVGQVVNRADVTFAPALSIRVCLLALFVFSFLFVSTGSYFVIFFFFFIIILTCRYYSGVLPFLYWSVRFCFPANYTCRLARCRFCEIRCRNGPSFGFGRRLWLMTWQYNVSHISSIQYRWAIWRVIQFLLYILYILYIFLFDFIVHRICL